VVRVREKVVMIMGNGNGNGKLVGSMGVRLHDVWMIATHDVYL